MRGYKGRRTRTRRFFDAVGIELYQQKILKVTRINGNQEKKLICV